MDSLLLRGPVLGHGQTSLLIEDGRISELGARSSPREPIEAAPDELIAPGFIDLQVNGYAGCDAAEGAEAIAEIARRLPATGVTAFLPTLISSPLERISRFVDAADSVDAPGARVLGAHVEGPFINPQFRGAHDPGQILEPTQERVSNLLARPPRMVTLAPELPGALRAVERLRAAGVVVAAGHSGADFAQGMAGIAAGVRFGTHVFNAMTRFHHREPGLVAALLLDRRVALGLVLDGQHVHAAAAGLVLRIKPPRLCVLTTDQTSAAGAPPGRYRIGGREVRSDGRSVRLPDGTLAGSAAGMDELVREAAAAIGLTRAVRMASEAPARLLGERGLGRIEPGSAADLVVLDRNRRPRLTIVAGRVVYERR